MKPYLLFIISLILFPMYLFSQSKSIYVEADWIKGAVYNYSIEKVYQQFQNDELIQESKLGYNTQMNIIDSTGSGYTISWRIPSDALSLDENIEVNSMLKNYFSESTIQIIYKTSAKGTFQKVENREELLKMIASSANNAIEAERNSPSDESRTTIEFLTGYANLSVDKNLILEKMTKEIQAIHYPFGNTFKLDESIAYTEEIKNKLGGDDFVCKGSIAIESVDFDLNYCIITQELSLEESESKNALHHYFNEMSNDSERVTEQVNASKISIFEDNVYEYLYQPGVALSIEMNRAIKIDLENVVNLIVEELYIVSLDEHEMR